MPKLTSPELTRQRSCRPNLRVKCWSQISAEILAEQLLRYNTQVRSRKLFRPRDATEIAHEIIGKLEDG